jgi:hypothetical protein
MGSLGKSLIDVSFIVIKVSNINNCSEVEVHVIKSASLGATMQTLLKPFTDETQTALLKAPVRTVM